MSPSIEQSLILSS